MWIPPETKLPWTSPGRDGCLWRDHLPAHVGVAVVRKLSRVVPGFLALSALLLADLLADQLALIYFNQHLAWRLFFIPTLTLLAGLSLGLGLGAGFRGRVPVKWLQREGLGFCCLPSPDHRVERVFQAKR